MKIVNSDFKVHLLTLFASVCFVVMTAIGCSKSHKTLRPSLPAPAKTFAYAASYFSVTACDVNTETGRFTGCQDSGFAQYAFSNNISVTYTSVATLTVGEQTFAYVGNYANGTVYQCLIDANNGLFTGCAPSGTSFGDIIAVAFNTAQNGNIYAYVMDSSSSTVYQCLVNPITGQFSSTCPAESTASYGLLTFNTVGGQTYVYIPFGSAGSSTYQYCAVNADGSFVDCSSALSITGVVNPYAIGFITVANQTYAYITQNTDGVAEIVQCTVNSSNGSLANCFPAFFSAYYVQGNGLAVQSINNQPFVYFLNSGYYGYYFSPNVIQCGINSADATLQNCSDSGVGSIFLGSDDSYTANFAFATFN